MTKIDPIVRWVMICNHCGAPASAGLTGNDGAIEEMLPIYKTREEALKASIEAFDDTGQHPAVVQVVIQGIPNQM